MEPLKSQVEAFATHPLPPAWPGTEGCPSPGSHPLTHLHIWGLWWILWPYFLCVGVLKLPVKMTSEFSLPQSRACPWLTNQTPCVWYMLLIQEVMICIFSIQYTSMGVGGQHTCEDCGEHISLWDVILLFSTAISLMWVRPSSSIAARLMDQMVAASTCPRSALSPITLHAQLYFQHHLPFLSSLHFRRCSPTPSFK